MDSKTTLPRLEEDQLFSKPERLIISFSVLVVFYLYAFHPAFPTMRETTIAGWAWKANFYHDNFHGCMVPFISPFLVYLVYRENKNASLRPSYWGLLFLILGFFLFWVALRLQQPRVALCGAPFIIIGFSLYFFGSSITKKLIFPAFLIWFTVPFPVLERQFPYQFQPYLIDTVYELGLFMNMNLSLQGSTIITGSGNQVGFSVGSSFGVKAFWITLMTASLISYLTQRVLWKQWLLIGIALCLFLIASIMKVFTIVFFAELDLIRDARWLWGGAGDILVVLLTCLPLLLVNHLLQKPPKARQVRK